MSGVPRAPSISAAQRLRCPGASNDGLTVFQGLPGTLHLYRGDAGDQHERALASCGVAEALDFALIRPGCLASAAWLLLPLPGGVWLGMVTGKAVADVVWYGAEASVRRGLARSLAT